MTRINDSSVLFHARRKKAHIPGAIKAGKSAIASIANVVSKILHPGINWIELRHAYRVFIANPSQGILHIIAAGANSHWQRWVEARLGSQAQHLKHANITIDISSLLELPESTLGGAYARHITSQGFDPQAFITTDDQDDNWVRKRAALSHDVYHIITGFDGSPMGEFGLAAYCLVQYRDLLNTFVLSHVPYFMMGNPQRAASLMATLARGFNMGLRSKPIFAYPFEANWHKSIAEVRSELGI